MADVTRILSKIEQGDPSAAEQLLPLVYDELRKLAAAKMAQEAPGQTLQATALVHEAYMRLVDVEKAQHWNSRRHFFGVAAEAMRRILIDNARRKLRPKHGGNRQRVAIEDVEPAGGDAPDRLIQIDEALNRLAEEDQTAAEVVKLCYFGGLDVEQSADLLEISRATAYRHWNYAKAWLHAEVQREK
jgi:RNA polymerase sigma factor (TIGR02999 family)